MLLKTHHKRAHIQLTVTRVPTHISSKIITAPVICSLFPVDSIEVYCHFIEVLEMPKTITSNNEYSASIFKGFCGLGATSNLVLSA